MIVMAGDTLFQVSWIGGDLEEVKPIARKILDETVWLTDDDYVKKENDEYRTNVEVKDFFENIVSGKSYFAGWKGELWLWGTVGKFTDIEYFLKMTIPFFKELWEKEIVLESRNVVIVDEFSDSHARIYVLSYDEEKQEAAVSEPFHNPELTWGT